MFNLLIKLIFFAALMQFGMSIADVEECNTRECMHRIENASRDVLHIDWKPISVFPEEATKFK